MVKALKATATDYGARTFPASITTTGRTTALT